MLQSLILLLNAGLATGDPSSLPVDAGFRIAELRAARHLLFEREEAIARCRRDVEAAMRCARGVTADWAFFLDESGFAGMESAGRGLKEASAALEVLVREARAGAGIPGDAALAAEVALAEGALDRVHAAREWGAWLGRLPAAERNRAQRVRNLDVAKRVLRIPAEGSLQVPADQSLRDWRKGDPVRVARCPLETGGRTHLVKNLRTGAWIEASR